MKSGNYTEKILNRRKALMVLLIISILASVFCIDFPVNAAGTRQGVINGTYVNVRNGSLKDAMNSPLFRKLRDEGYLLEDHEGGCLLYEKRELVEQLINA